LEGLSTTNFAVVFYLGLYSVIVFINRFVSNSSLCKYSLSFKTRQKRFSKSTTAQLSQNMCLLWTGCKTCGWNTFELHKLQFMMGKVTLIH